MTSMWRRNINLIAFLLIICTGFGQEKDRWLKNPFKKKLELAVTKTGPYLGVQQGKYLNAEFGLERQWAQISLKTQKTHALNTGFMYNIRYNVLGYDFGYWYKGSRIGLTFGGNLMLRTDFDNTRFGFAPVVGYKFWWLHLQTGYQFLTPIREDLKFETNTFFVSLRFVMINDRDIELKKKNRKSTGIFGS